MRLIASYAMMDEVRRPWKERLFTMPWRPWRATCWVPSRDVLVYGDVMVAHPEVAQEIREAGRLWVAGEHNGGSRITIN